MAGRRRRSAIAAIVAIAWVIASSPAASADALFPSASDGTWTGDGGATCDDVAWTSPPWGLWVIIGKGMTYPFDVPNPTFILGESLTIELSPVVVGTLPGNVTLLGSHTVTATVSAPGQYMLGSQPTFQLAYKPGGSTSGVVPVPAQWAGEFPGFVGVNAKLTGDRGMNTEITILAHGLRRCPPFSTSIDESPSATSDGWLIPTAVGLLAFLFVLRRSVGLGRPLRIGRSVGDGR